MARIYAWDITDRKQAQEAQQDSETKYRLLFESNPQPMWVYDLESLAFLKVNRAAVDLYGYSREEFLAMTIKDIRPPEDVAPLLKRVKELAPGLGYSGEWRHGKKSGEIIDVEIVSHEIAFNGRRARLVLAQDVTARKAAEEAQRQAHQKLQAIIQASPLSIFVLDPEGRVLLWNSASEKTFGWTESEAMGTVLPIVPEDRMEEFRDNLRRALSGEPLRDMELRRRRKDGTPIDIRIFTSTLYDSQGEATGVMAVNADITERKQAEEELNQNLREMTLLNKISHLISSSISLEHMVHATVNGIVEYLDTDLAIFFLKEDASLPLLIVGPQDSRYKFGSVPAHCVGECLCGLAARDGQPIYVQDIRTDPRCTMVECKEAGLQSFAALPLKSGNRVIGILGLASGTPRDFKKLASFGNPCSGNLPWSKEFSSARRSYEASRGIVARNHRAQAGRGGSET